MSSLGGPSNANKDEEIRVENPIRILGSNANKDEKIRAENPIRILGTFDSRDHFAEFSKGLIEFSDLNKSAEESPNREAYINTPGWGFAFLQLDPEVRKYRAGDRVIQNRTYKTAPDPEQRRWQLELSGHLADEVFEKCCIAAGKQDIQGTTDALFRFLPTFILPPGVSREPASGGPGRTKSGWLEDKQGHLDVAAFRTKAVVVYGIGPSGFSRKRRRGKKTRPEDAESDSDAEWAAIDRDIHRARQLGSDVGSGRMR